MSSKVIESMSGQVLRRSLEVIRGHQMSSKVIRGHQIASVASTVEVIRGHEWSFEVIRGHSSPQAQSHLILPWEEGKGFDIKARIELYHEKGAVARSAEERVVLEDLHSLCGRGESPPDEGGNQPDEGGNH